MTQVGKIGEIWRFPVKSMQGDTIPACTVSPRGVAGDRAWAMRDETRAEVQWGKMFPQLMLCKARYRTDPDSEDSGHDQGRSVGADVGAVDVTFPDGETLGSDDERIHAKLSELVGREATLRPLQPASDVQFYKRYKPDEAKFLEEIAAAFAREPGEPMPELSQFPEVLMDHVSVPGTFFDNEELHLMTTASLDWMAYRAPDSVWDVRRFRPNFLIRTTRDLEGLVENDWVGRRLRIGDATLEISAPTVRCGMTVRPQDDLEYDKQILRTVVREGNQCLGVGAHVREGGRIRQGDAVVLLD